ncbi:HAD domain-containing protein [Comamonas sp.]|uniref:HAD domain-containing protein n=1 Tax=Comamonas sp. TaxID=34028 RepID=UPI00289B6911|nr:HAD domain-containing protein [Comamonas sp.]
MLTVRPLLFLDFDDVICLNQPYGGYDALKALSEASQVGSPIKKEVLWSRLFNKRATHHLQQVNEEFSPNYVLSTSWRWFFERDLLVQTLELGGLSFIAQNLHKDCTTPRISRDAQRAVEIRRWLSNHPESAGTWVVLDDELSGTGFSTWPWDKLDFVVLCQEGVGLGELEYQRLREAFALRMSS